MKNYRFIISGGGTGGHIFPAIAIAQEIQRRYPTAEFLFVGAKDRMEMQKVPQAGFPIIGLWIAGLQRKLTLSNLLFPLKLMLSVIKSRKIIRQFKPDMAIGTGGFASGPLLKAAHQKNIPTLLQEQNSYAGITNKWLAQKAHRICVAYPHMERYFPAEKIVFTGNPIRQEVLQLGIEAAEAKASFGFLPHQKVLLILGGSLGAKRINELVASRISLFEKLQVGLIWQTGKWYIDSYKNVQSKNVFVTDFIQEMNLAYAAADFIVSRAGAGSVSELCVVGKPVLFIPSPNVAEDHQSKNAASLVNENAALCIAEKDLDTSFDSVFEDLVKDENQQHQLSESIKKLAKPMATSAIVDEIEKIVNYAS